MAPAVIALEIVLAVGLPVDLDLAVLGLEPVLPLQRDSPRPCPRSGPAIRAGRAAALDPDEDEPAPFLGVDPRAGPRRRGRGSRCRRNRWPCGGGRRARSSSYGRDRRSAHRSAPPPRARALRAAVPADIVEAAHPTVGRRARRTRDSRRSCRAHSRPGRLEPLGPGEQHPVAGEDLLALALEQGRVAVPRGRHGPGIGWSGDLIRSQGSIVRLSFDRRGRAGRAAADGPPIPASARRRRRPSGRSAGRPSRRPRAAAASEPLPAAIAASCTSQARLR